MIFRIALFLFFPLLFITGCGGGGGPQGGMIVPIVGYKVEAQNIDNAIQLVGSLTAYEDVELRSEIAGRIEQIGFEEGSEVEKGDILFRINAKELKAEVDEAQANFVLAEANYKRSNVLIKKGTVSRQEHDQAVATYTAAKAALARINDSYEESLIRAPFSGKLGARLVSPGEYVTEGDSLSSLVSTDPLRITADVPEKFLGQLQVGQTFRLRVAAYKERDFTGKITFIAPQVQSGTRTVLIKGETSNSDGLLRPGMFAQLALTLETLQDAVVIPDSAIMLEKDNAQVYVIEEQDGDDGKKTVVRLQQISIGEIIRGNIVVSDGLKPGEKIVAEGYQKLFPGAAIAVTRWKNESL